MQRTFDERLASVPWATYETAYGPATDVPDQLRRLASHDAKAALAASHELWCGLCHQHVFVSSAALPALPFLLQVLDGAGPQLAVEILDIFLGFARCTRDLPPAGADAAGPPQPPRWVAELRTRLRAEHLRLARLAGSADPEVAEFAGDVLDELGVPDA